MGCQRGPNGADLRIPVNRPVLRILLSPDGKRIVGGLDDDRCGSGPETGDELESLDGDGIAIAELIWSDDGERLIARTEDGSIRSWNSITWDPEIDLDGKMLEDSASDLGPGFDRMAIVNNSRNVSLLDVETGDVMFTLRGNDHDIDMVSFSPDGTRLVASCDNGLVRIWNTLPSAWLAEKLDGQLSLRQQMESTVDGWIGSPGGESDTIERNVSMESRIRSAEEMNAIRSLLMGRSERQ